MTKTALITGITGQDGAYLSRFLLDKGYVVHGLHRRSSVDNTERLWPILDHPHLHLHEGDLTDSPSLFRVLKQAQPDEVYNLGAQSHVGTSFHIPEYTGNVDGLGVVRLLEAIRTLEIPCRFYQASSSELFGNAPAPQNEETVFEPCSPYAAAKLYAYWTVSTYRKAYGIHASNGILFNHESPWRGEDFVTRKVTKGVAEITAGVRSHIELGNLDAMRDWGHARDYVEGMWMMMQQDQPNDYILATGHAYSVRQLVEYALEEVDIQIEWEGEDQEEVGRDARTGDILVTVNPKFFRSQDVNYLCGDSSKAKEILGWTPKTSFRDMIKEMVEADMKRLSPHWTEDDEIRIFKVAA